jgi:hypothetical protein
MLGDVTRKLTWKVWISCVQYSLNRSLFCLQLCPDIKMEHAVEQGGLWTRVMFLSGTNISKNEEKI